ncbi:nucleoside triphosphate pyrophosphohydrolase [Nonomuraea sp. NPDC050790]|uniref:nucleoside triphosphate pyrophosphohydrolase n=1 Tax=Nonomuraea sp. NPDC050790 TaxID=3364371 RepID=UPI0037B289B3
MGKLVRDNIPEIIRRGGGEPDVRVLGVAEYRGALLAKLFEEATELREAPADEVAGEIADVYEVLRAIAAVDGLEWDAVEKVADGKRAERGGFRDRLYLA